MKIQVTLYCDNGKYKPVSCIIDKPADFDKKLLQKAGIEKICIKRNWTTADLKKYGYTKIKMRKVVDNK